MGLDVHVSTGGNVTGVGVNGVVGASMRGMLEVLERADELSMLDACQDVVREGAMDLEKVTAEVVVDVVMVKNSIARTLAWGALTMGAVAHSAGGIINQGAA